MRSLPGLCLAGAVLTAVSCSDDREDASPPPPVTAVSANVDLQNGEVLYVQRCLTCHQADGSGVPGMQPALVGHASLSGEPDRLIEVTLRGIGGEPPAIPATGKYAMVMPGAMDLSDQHVADLLSYIRQTFADEGAVSPQEVGAVRASID